MPGVQLLEAGTKGLRMGFLQIRQSALQIAEPGLPRILHNIVDRPVALNGQVVIRPMMYVALSYDHRIIDGRESVGFLVRVKQLLENPERMLLGV